MSQLFTLESANEAVAIIRPLLAEILQIRQEILEKQPELWPALEKSRGNGGNRPASEVALKFKRLETLVRRIQDIGAEIKDINTGLVDFPSIRDGRKVCLCWQYGEEEIQYWHDLDAGFAGRQPL